MRTVAGTLAQAQAFEQGGSAGVALGRWRAGINGRHFHVFLGRARGNQVIALEHEAKGFPAQPGQFVAAQLGNIFASKEIVAAGGAVQATEDVHQCRLA
ncbi:hypothetical protein D9M71_51060 [compost metagenome]